MEKYSKKQKELLLSVDERLEDLSKFEEESGIKLLEWSKSENGMYRINLEPFHQMVDEIQNRAEEMPLYAEDEEKALEIAGKEVAEEVKRKGEEKKEKQNLIKKKKEEKKKNRKKNKNK